MEVYCILSITFTLQNTCIVVKEVIVNGVCTSLNEGRLNGVLQRLGSWPSGTFCSVSKTKTLSNFWKNPKMTKIWVVDDKTTI